MNAQPKALLNRLETLTWRERALMLVMVPVVLGLLGDLLVFDGARKQAGAAEKLAAQQENDVKALTATLAAMPATAPGQAPDQLERQRDELLQKIEAARQIKIGGEQAIDWGMVVRASVPDNAGLTLAQFRTLPAEVVFSPPAPKPDPKPDPKADPKKPVLLTLASVSAAAAKSEIKVAAAAAALDTGDTIYRHRVELTVKGNFSALLAYLQSLQRMPGGLRWDRLTLSMDAYPQASAQLMLYTLSNRPDTPFN